MNKNRNSNSSKGFTLIEVLIVVAIIGIIASVVLVAVNQARANGRDAKRVQDLKQLTLALDLYYQDHGTYPPCESGGDPYCGSCNPNGYTEFANALQPLVDEGYLLSIPKDPLNKANCQTYEYTTQSDDVWGGACNNSPIGEYYYIIRFATERMTLDLPEWIYQRTSGTEYCFTGFLP